MIDIEPLNRSCNIGGFWNGPRRWCVRFGDTNPSVWRFATKHARLASGINPVTSFDAKAEHEATAGVVGCHDVVAARGYHHFALYSSGKPHNAVFGETCAWHVLEYPGLAAWKTPKPWEEKHHNFGATCSFRCSNVPRVGGFPLFGQPLGLACPTLPSPFLERCDFHQGNMFICKTASLATAVNSAPWWMPSTAWWRF